MSGQFLQAYALLAVVGTLLSIIIGNLKTYTVHESVEAKRRFVLALWTVWYVVWSHPVFLTVLQASAPAEACQCLGLQQANAIWHLLALIAVGLGFTLAFRAFPTKVAKGLNSEED